MTEVIASLTTLPLVNCVDITGISGKKRTLRFIINVYIKVLVEDVHNIQLRY